VKADAVAVALPGRKVPDELVTVAVHAVAGAVHGTKTWLLPLTVARRATT
jgi:hypothetical protein